MPQNVQGPGERARPGTAGIACLSGPMSSGRLSCGESHSVGSAHGGACVSGPPTWTTSGITRAIGHRLSTGGTWRACAIPATAARPCGNSGKIDEKDRAGRAANVGSFGRAGARMDSGACAGQGYALRPSPPVKKVFARPVADRTPPFVRDFFPMGAERRALWPASEKSPAGL